MKTKTPILLCATVALLSLLTVSSASVLAGTLPQAQTSGPKLSDAEMQALKAINAAPDANAKIAGVADFIKKYPKSGARLQLAELVSDEVTKATDPAQAIVVAEKAQTIFTAEPELAVIRPALLDAYTAGKRSDDAFKLGNEMLAKNAEDIHALVQMTFIGTEEAKQKNPKFVQQSLQSGLKAITVIEADKKPLNMNDASWASHKAMLPQLYQETAILSLVTGNPTEAKARLVKSTSLGPTDPSSFALLGLLINDEYIQLATSYKAMPDGPPKVETLKKLEAMLDNIIDVYAHAAGLATGKPEYQALYQQVMTDLTSYYKFRHKQSVEGLQQLVDKYKSTP